MNNAIFSLSGRVAVVTGALGLLGREHCKALASVGACVIACDIDGERAKEFAKTLPTESLGLGVNVTSKESLSAASEVILKKFGRIDILVNNAAINDMVENPIDDVQNSGFEKYPLELWRRVLDVNVTGVFLSSQIFGAIMAEIGSGSIINIASTYGVVAPDQSLYINADGKQTMFKSPVYPASKGAVIAFTRYLATYWAKSGVRVNTLSPGGVENGQEAWFIHNYSQKTPLGRMAKPNDYHGAVIFLASDASSYVTGANVVVDGGWTIW